MAAIAQGPVLAAKHPAEGTSPSPSRRRGSPARGTAGPWPAGTLDLVSSTTTAHRLFAARPRRAALLDVTVATAALVGTLALLAHGGIRPALSAEAARSGAADLDPTGVVLAACSTLPLVAWRRSPLRAFVVTAVASLLLVGLDYPLDLALGPAVALYLLAAGRQPEEPWTARTTIVVVGLFVAYVSLAGAAQGAFPGPELLHSGLAWAGAWFAGERTRLRRRNIAELRDRALRTEREAERERLLAVAEERARIARDLHDSAGHAISVIAVRAGAARLRHHQEPDRSLAALEAIENLARQTADEIDQIVGTLRQGPPNGTDGAIEAPRGLVSLDTLIARHVAAGLEVTVDATGTPGPLGGPADQAAYRILQEALTNAARHGAGSARVELAFGEAAVEITVTNPVLADDRPRSSGGHGLVGMRERASLLGGRFDAERTNGTFRVHARIPDGGHGG
jgi:signal transduction histidine kinase